jgi:hypothetical protein
MKQVDAGGRFIRSGFWLLLWGFVMSFGMVLRYVVGARYDNGPDFLKNVSLWFGCPWTLSTAVVLGGALGLIVIGAVYAILGKMDPRSLIEGAEKIALPLCITALIAIFLTGYVGYFVVDTIWPSFYYSPIKDGKNVWLFMQLACMVLYAVGVFLAFVGIRRTSHTMA